MARHLNTSKSRLGEIDMSRLSIDKGNYINRYASISAIISLAVTGGGTYAYQ